MQMFAGVGEASRSAGGLVGLGIRLVGLLGVVGL